MNTNNKQTSPSATTKGNCPSNSPFVNDIASENNNNPQLFLGVVNKRYIKTFHGIIHGLGSISALILGNCIFADRVLVGNNVDYSNNDWSLLQQRCDIIFHICNLTASIITAIFFWNKVQSWQLSTTTTKEKGLTPQILQKFNQGRGVISMILFSLFPLVCCIPQYVLESKIFSTVLALAFITGSAKVYNLIKEYNKILWVIYGLTPMALGISILCSGGTVASLNQRYPAVLDRIEKEASFVISCVQMGFMLYYLNSRNLVTQRTVQRICKTYHVTMSMAFSFRVERDLWLQFSGSGGSSAVPLPMLIQPMIVTLAMLTTLIPAIITKVLVGAKLATKQSKKFKEVKTALLLGAVSASNSSLSLSLSTPTSSSSVE